MALNFPNSPSNGDTHNAANGLTYSYDGTKWVTQGSYTTGAIQAQKLTDISSSFNGSTTTFNLTSGSDTVKPHNDNSVLIVVNGTVQEPTTAYTIDSSAGTITFTSGNIPTAGQSFFGIVNSRLPTSSADSLALTGGTMTGSITFAAGQVIPVDKIQDANTTQEGVVQLEDSTTSTSTNKAATPNSIKVTKDIADAALPKAGGTMTGNITFNSGQGFDASKITSGTLPIARLGADIDTTKMTAATVVTNSEQGSHTANDTSFYTTQAADARFYNLASAEEIQSGETWSAADNLVATTAAIDARITDLVDDVGGFVPIANELAFPNANPDVNNGAGTLVSIKSLSTNYTSSGSGVISISNGTVGNSTVTINGAENSTTYASGFGMIVETTTTLNTYTFHRLVPKATEVTTVAANNTNVSTVATNIANVNLVGTNISNVNSFSDQYKVASSAPGSPSEGDLWYDSANNVLKYHNGTTFVTVVAGIANLIEDQTPELYAALDCNDKNLTEVATISGTNLQIDFGTL